MAVYQCVDCGKELVSGVDVELHNHQHDLQYLALNKMCCNKCWCDRLGIEYNEKTIKIEGSK